MPSVHINPDHFLQTDAGRIITPELNAEAWKKSFETLENALAGATAGTLAYILVGAQGSGKSTWAKLFKNSSPSAVIFDAILVKRSERKPILKIAGKHVVPAVAVWFKTPLEVCLLRNAARPVDEVVSERALRNVFAALEPPAAAEGFDSVLEVAG